MEEFRRGWGPLLAATTGTMCGLLTITIYSQGFFVGPVMAEFGWLPAQFFFGFTIMMCLGLITGPMIGSLAARYGAKRIGVIGLVGHAAAYLLISLNPGSLALWYASFALLAVLGAGSLPIIWTSVLNGWFDRHFGKAIGITMAGTGVGAILLPPIAQHVISTYGWRVGYQAIGVGALLLSLPIVLLLFRENSAAVSASPHGSRSDLVTWGMTRRQALATFKFWNFGLALLLSVFVTVGLLSNFARILGEKGMDPESIASIASLMGIMIVVGRLLGGALIDRFWAPGVAAAFFLLPITALSLLLYVPLTLAVGVVVGAFIGLAAGAELDMLAYLTRRYFGPKHYAKVFGAVFAIFSLAAGIAPPVFGAASASLRGYDPVLGVSIAFLAATMLLFLTLGRYPEHARAGSAFGRRGQQDP
jgi:MFS transporter, OFA family, oxalate/formate antiporter